MKESTAEGEGFRFGLQNCFLHMNCIGRIALKAFEGLAMSFAGLQGAAGSGLHPHPALLGALVLVTGAALAW